MLYWLTSIQLHQLWTSGGTVSYHSTPALRDIRVRYLDYWILGISQGDIFNNQTYFVFRATLGRVCLKLVVVMGLTWVADVISWAVGGPHYIWYVTDLINTLQGVFIFLVAGCQPQVWSSINRLWCLRQQRTQRTNMGNHLSLYSQGPPSLGDSVTNNHSTKSAHLETLCWRTSESCSS
jgi:hypothetical protein